MQSEELFAWLRLTHTRGVGREGARRLLAAFGLPQAIFDADDAALRQVVGAAQIAQLRLMPDQFDTVCARTRAWLDGGNAQGSGARALVTLGDSRYPARLLEIEDPPVLLYLQGRLPGADTLDKNEASNNHLAHDHLAQPAINYIANDLPRCIAIVGTRNPTPQGAQNAHAFAAYFAAAGWCVVSGLALGIDAEAHKGALAGAVPAADPASDDNDDNAPVTIAVVGTGLDEVYPRRNAALAAQIFRQGLLMSEYPLGTPPLAHNFPRRNRLISGLALGTLVVEATQPSGSLITARMALEQGREVFAIPGSIHSPQSRGCHALIRQGAKLVECAQDVLEELPDAHRTAPSMASAAPSPATALGGGKTRSLYRAASVGTTSASQMTMEDDVPLTAAPRESALLLALGFDPVGLDALVARTGIDAARLQGQLLELELDGAVARLPGGLFQRIASA